MENKVIYVIASKDEYEFFKKINYPFESYPVLIAGVGAANIIRSLKDLDKDTTIINVGCVGSYYYPVDSIVKVKYAVQSHEFTNFDTPIFELEGDGEATCISYGDFYPSLNKDEKTVFDMELAFILALGFKKVYSYKYVSDNSNPEQYDHKIRG